MKVGIDWLITTFTENMVKVLLKNSAAGISVKNLMNEKEKRIRELAEQQKLEIPVHSKSSFRVKDHILIKSILENVLYFVY